jgi:hypothetical protein
VSVVRQHRAAREEKIPMTLASDNRDAVTPREPRMGIDFPLAAFEQHIAADPDVLGMLYTGSLKHGGTDRCSDLDITLWLRDEALARPGLLEHYVSWLGEIHLLHWSKHEHGLSSNCFVGPDWQQAELDIMDSHHPEPHPYWHQARVVKGTDGRLAALVAASGPPVATLSRDAARHVIGEVIYHIGFVTMHNVRGSHYHAMGNLCELASSVYGLLTNARGREAYDVRHAEAFLRDDELTLLYAAWPVAPEREAIRRAARGLWAWVQYVWGECEQALGEELGVTLDTAVFLDAVERPYAWERLTSHKR